MTDIKHTPRHISRHTPAPWEHDGTGLVYGTPVDETGGSTFVCDVVQDGQREWMDDTEKANARLIAAAPELLEALQKVREGFELDFFVAQFIKDALAKATGEA